MYWRSRLPTTGAHRMGVLAHGHTFEAGKVAAPTLT
jgi:hypothetical protein